MKKLLKILYNYIVIWGCAYKTHLNELIVDQENIIKAMYKLPKYYPPDIYFL